MDACHGLATSPQRASWTTRPADAKRVFRRLCTPRARPASPRTGAGPDGRAGSTALRSAAWGPPACAAGLMRSTRAHGAGIAAMAAIWLRPRGTAHERQARIGTGKKSKTEIENRNRTRNPEVSTSLGSRGSISFIFAREWNGNRNRLEARSYGNGNGNGNSQ